MKPRVNASKSASKSRRGVSMLELLTSIAILGLVMTILAQCTLSGGRAFRETRRRDQALELCNRALERVAAADSSRDNSLLTAIAGQVSDDDFQVDLSLESDDSDDSDDSDESRVTATATWENDLGAEHSLRLHAWLPTASAEPTVSEQRR